MRLKLHKLIGIFVWPLVILAASLPIDSVASVLQGSVLQSSVFQSMATTDLGVNRPPSVRAVSYGAPIYPYSASPRSAEAKNASRMGASSVSAAPEVDGWAMLAAILGLISMRLWHGGKKKLPAIK